MVRKSIFTLLFMAAIGWASAQSLQMEWNGQVYADGETVVCTYLEEWGEYVQHFQVRNLSANSIDVMAEKQMVKDLEGTDVSFCWGGCFSPVVNVSPRPVVVQGETLSEEDLSLHVIFNDVVGNILVRFTIYNAQDPDEKVSVLVQFANDGTGVAESLSKCDLSHAYPNPAASAVHFNYDLAVADNASVTVFNLLGQEVMSTDLNGQQGKVNFSVADLNEGIYFCNLTVNGRVVKTEKFIVKK